MTFNDKILRLFILFIYLFSLSLHSQKFSIFLKEKITFKQKQKKNSLQHFPFSQKKKKNDDPNNQMKNHQRNQSY